MEQKRKMLLDSHLIILEISTELSQIRNSQYSTMLLSTFRERKRLARF